MQHDHETPSDGQKFGTSGTIQAEIRICYQGDMVIWLNNKFPTIYFESPSYSPMLQELEMRSRKCYIIAYNIKERDELLSLTK